MTQRTEQYQQHPLWETLRNLGPTIDVAYTHDAIDAESADALTRLKSILTFTGSKLAGTDPYLIQIASFDNLNNALTLLKQEVHNFNKNRNKEHLISANTHADSVLTHLAQINIQVTTEDFLAAKESAEAYRVGMGKALEVVTEKTEEFLSEITKDKNQSKAEVEVLQKQLANLSEELNKERDKISTVVSEYQSQFSKAQESRGSTFVASEKDRQDRFSTIFNDYTQKLSEQNADFTKQRDQIANLHQNELAELKREFVEQSTQLHNEMLNHKADIEKLVGVIGNLGVTSGYLNTANDAKGKVRIWQLVTVGAMLVLIEIAYVAFLPEVMKEFSWPSFAGRVFVALSIGALAAYAGTQADKYQKIERYNRRLALELEAIGPYIAPLGEREQKDFRIKIGERTFGQGEDAQGKLDTKSPTNLLDVLADPEKKTLLAGIIDLIKHK